MIRKKRKRGKRIQIILLVFLGFVLAIALTVLIAIEFFTVEKVKVEGNEIYPSDQIQEWVLKDEYAWNSLYVVLKYKFFETEEIPFIDTLEVSLENPHTLHIKVYEKGMLGYLYIDSIGQNAYFDKDGFVVETSTDIIEGIPKISGMSCDAVVLYEQLPLENEIILKKILTLTQILKKYNILPEQIIYDSNSQPTLIYGGVQVIVGEDEELSQKIIRLSHILPNLEGMTGTLHLENWTEQTTDIVFDKAE